MSSATGIFRLQTAVCKLVLETIHLKGSFGARSEDVGSKGERCHILSLKGGAKLTSISSKIQYKLLD